MSHRQFVVVFFFLFLAGADAQHYGNKFEIAPNNYANDFTIDRLAQEVYFDYYKGWPFKVSLKTMVVESTNFIAPAFGNNSHLMFYGDTLYNMEKGDFFALPLPDSSSFTGSLTISFPHLFSPNDSCLIFSITSTVSPHLVKGYVFVLKDSSLIPVDTSVNFYVTLPPQWSSDTSFVFGANDSSLAEYFVYSRRIDTLVIEKKYKITSFAYNTRLNVLAYGVGNVNQIYFHLRHSISDSLVFSPSRDDSSSVCWESPISLGFLSWSPGDTKLGFLVQLLTNPGTGIYVYSADSNRTYKATICEDEGLKYSMQWANEDTLIYTNSTDGHIYGISVQSIVDEIVTQKQGGMSIDFDLSSYPNPFNGSVTIVASIPRHANGVLSIFDAVGRLIKTYNLHYEGKSIQQIVWNADNLGGTRVASGIYFAVLRLDASSAAGRKITKIIYLK